MTGQDGEMRDLVHVHLTADLPMRANALPFADRVEIKLGKAFPVALIIDRRALDHLEEAIRQGRAGLAAGDDRKGVS